MEGSGDSGKFASVVNTLKMVRDLFSQRRRRALVARKLEEILQEDALRSLLSRLSPSPRLDEDKPGLAAQIVERVEAMNKLEAWRQTSQWAKEEKVKEAKQNEDLTGLQLAREMELPETSDDEE